MTTAVDTSVLLDVFQGSGPFARRSAQALSSALREGSLIICELVYAELAAFAEEQSLLDALLAELAVQVAPVGRPAAFTAGRMFAEYRRAGGERRAIVADFVIAAHARHHSERLLTRDRGFLRSYFGDLQIIDPAGA